jgi:peptidyl-dipeptidase A
VSGQESVLGRVETELRQLSIRSNEAYWVASTTGTEEAGRRAAAAETDLRKWYADPKLRGAVAAELQNCPLDEPLKKRQLDLLNRDCIKNALPEEVIEDLVSREQSIQLRFITHRGQVQGIPATQNRIFEILKNSPDEALRLEAWTASKEIGGLVAEDLRELARRRNEAARDLGFRDYYAMELSLQEIDEGALFGIFDQLEELTAEPFSIEKAAIDRELGERWGLGDRPLLPHHYADPFFQESPTGDDFGKELDRQFEGKDLEELVGGYFAGLGLPTDNVLARSDLYEREGKDQHAYCMHVDREDDIRVLCNLQATERWTGTLLHELGHAVYDEFLPRTLPFLLRCPSHILTTEAVAMFFGRLTRHPGWLRQNCGTTTQDAARLAGPLARVQRRAMLILCRWVLVMTHFERAFYADPNRSDLNRVWWDLCERMQLMTPPDTVESGSEWATKIHLAVAPVYYHNYLLGELFASQLYATLAESVPTEEGFTNQPAVGDFFREKVFGPGGSMPWQELAVHATGQPLSPGFFIEEFVR